MSSVRSLLFPLAACVFVSILVACGGGGGGGGNNNSGSSFNPNTVSGTVNAPAGSIAHLEVDKPNILAVIDFLISSGRAALTGLTPVANATIELIFIDNDGNQDGAVITTTTSDSNGAYSFVLPTGVAPSADLVVQVKDSADQPVLRAMVTGETVDIDPVSQIVLDTLVGEAGVILANLDTDIVQTLVDQLTAIDLDFSTVSTIAEAMSIVESSAEVIQVLNDEVSTVANTALIVGAWGDGTTDPFMLVLYPNGFYVHWQDCTDTADGVGVEYGTYVYDGEFFSARPVLDENGGCGLSEWASMPVSLDADALNFGGSEPGTLVRAWNRDSASISGGWDTRVTLVDPGGLVFYENGYYIQRQGVDADGSDCTGVEYGTYSFDGDDLAGTILYDENDSCGLGEGVGDFSFPSVTVTDNTITFRDGGDPVSFNRIETNNQLPPEEISIVSIELDPDQPVAIDIVGNESGSLDQLLGNNSLFVTYSDGFSELIECDNTFFDVDALEHILECQSPTTQQDIYLGMSSSNPNVLAFEALIPELGPAFSIWYPISSGEAEIQARPLFGQSTAILSWNVTLNVIDRYAVVAVSITTQDFPVELSRIAGQSTLQFHELLGDPVNGRERLSYAFAGGGGGGNCILQADGRGSQNHLLVCPDVTGGERGEVYFDIRSSDLSVIAFVDGHWIPKSSGTASITVSLLFEDTAPSLTWDVNLNILSDRPVASISYLGPRPYNIFAMQGATGSIYNLLGSPPQLRFLFTDEIVIDLSCINPRFDFVRDEAQLECHYRNYSTNYYTRIFILGLSSSASGVLTFTDDIFSVAKWMAPGQAGTTRVTATLRDEATAPSLSWNVNVNIIP